MLVIIVATIKFIQSLSAMQLNKKTTITLVDDQGSIPEELLVILKQQNPSSSKNNLTSQILAISHRIKTWNCSAIYLLSKEQPKLFSPLKNIQFQRLKLVWFLNVQIETVEALARFKAPVLQNITIWNNHISSILSIKKIQSKELSEINIEQNHINEIECLSQGNWNKLSQIWINSINNHQNQSIRIVAKLSFTQKNKNIIGIRGKKRIMETPVIQAFVRKVKNTQVLSAQKIFGPMV